MLRARSNWGILVVSTFLVATLAAACGSEVEGGGNGGTGGTDGTGGTGGTGGAGGGGGQGADGQIAACDGPGQCTLVQNSCCGPCGEPTLGDYDAVNAESADAYFNVFVCPEPMPCPACAITPNPDLFAYCEAGKCAGADVTAHAFSECTTAADCTLRMGLGCCEGCAGDAAALVAVASSELAALHDAICPPDFGCPACAPMYPPEWKADCVAGHCAVVPTMP